MAIKERRTAAQQFVDWMDRRRFSQKEAAEYLGWPEPVISKLANGKERIGLERAFTLQRLTGIPAEAWITELASGIERDLVGAGKRKVAK